MKQLTKDQAIRLAESSFWEEMSAKEIADFQMNQNLLCMPFEVFHKALEEVLGRPVFTHELAFDPIRAELRGERSKPTFDEVLNLIPESKRILVIT